MKLLPENRSNRARFAPTLLLLIAGIALSVSAQTNPVVDADHPAAVAAAQLGHAIAEGDVEQLKILLAPDVLIFESGNVESSLAEYESHHMQSDIAFMKTMNVEVESRQVIGSGDTAIVVTRSRIHGMYKEQELDLSSTETLVMKKMGGQWKIIHIHWSSS
jgi:ketosteroid isomerase-like protein